jgi:hypothetical protein
MNLCCLLCGLLLFWAPLAIAAESLDRVVATVNGHVILQSEWEDELQYESLMSGSRSGQLATSSDRKAALDRLVDRELLSEQASTTDYVHTTADEIGKQLDQIKSDYFQGVKMSWSDALASHGFTESEVRDRIALQLNQMKMIDAHLRPSVQIDDSAVADYYQRQFLPEIRRSGAAPVALHEAAPKIRELLTQQKVNEALASWLEAMRSQAQIHYFVSNPSPSEQAR